MLTCSSTLAMALYSAHSSESPWALPCQPEAVVHTGSLAELSDAQPWLLADQFEVLSSTSSTLGTWEGMLGLVVNRSVSSPTRSTAAIAPAEARTTQTEAIRRRRVFILAPLRLTCSF